MQRPHPEVIRTLESRTSNLQHCLEPPERPILCGKTAYHTGWEILDDQWDEIMNSRLLRQIHRWTGKRVGEKFFLEGLRQMKDTHLQKDMLCSGGGGRPEYRYMAVIALFRENLGLRITPFLRCRMWTGEYARNRP